MQGFAAVTGATGHLGRILVHRLAATGRAVRAIGAEPVGHDRPEPSSGLPIERVQADVADRRAISTSIAGAEVVFHLAARVTITSGDDLFAPIDDGAVANVLDACAAHGVRRLVHVSPVAALVPDGPTGPPVVGSRARGEDLVRQAIDAGLDAVVVYPTGILGPGDPGRGHLNRMLLDLWRHRLPAGVGGGFDWVDVRDVADGIVAAATRAPAGGRYLLSGTWLTVDELVARAAAIGGLRPPRVVRAPAITTTSLATPTADDPFDPSRARCDLGYLPRSIDDTLRDTHAWFAERGLLSTGHPTRHLMSA